MNQLLLENSEEGSTFIQLRRISATTFYDSRQAAAVEIAITPKRIDLHTGRESRETFRVSIRKNEWTELKRLINEILKGR